MINCKKITQVLYLASFWMMYACGEPDNSIKPEKTVGCPNVDGFTCVDVAPNGTYGTKTLTIPSKQHWVNTGLYLRTGESVDISIIDGKFDVGPYLGVQNGFVEDCKNGSLVARIGLVKDDTISNSTKSHYVCISKSKISITASRDGILFLAMLAGYDMDEFKDSRSLSSGKVKVKISSKGVTSPSISVSQLRNYPIEKIESKYVEILGDHVMLLIPKDLAFLDKDNIPNTISKLDSIYKYQNELRGKSPYSGQRIRFLADPNLPNEVGAYAGNPVFINKEYIDKNVSYRITNLIKPIDLRIWSHEMGHTFTAVSGNVSYMSYFSSEVWPGIFGAYAYEKLEFDQASDCKKGDMGSYNNDSDPWSDDIQGALCFLRQFVFEFGWDIYAQFFQVLNQQTIDAHFSDVNYQPWPYLFKKLSSLKEFDSKVIERIFKEWNVPYQYNQ